MRKLRVLTLIDMLTPWGGGERLAAHISIRLDPNRFERTVCATRSANAGVVAELEAAGVRVFSLKRGAKTAVWQWAPLVSFLRRERIDVLHAHHFGSNVWGTLLGRLCGVPVIVTHEHGQPFESGPVRRVLDRRFVARYADVLIAVSRADRARMTESEAIDAAAVRFVPNGIPRFRQPTGHDVRAELGIPPAAPVVAAVAVLRPEKALEVLIEAAALLRAEFPDLRVLIAGMGDVRERLEQLTIDAGLADVVLLLGQRNDVPDVLEAADVAVSSSDSEGSPLAIMEYMAAGKAIVATRVGGIPDLIEDGVHGLLVERRHPPALAGAIARLLRDPSLRAKLGARARERQAREFDLDRTVARLAELYEQLFRASARGRRELARARRA